MRARRRRRARTRRPELDALRRQLRSERVDAAKKDLKKRLKAANA